MWQDSVTEEERRAVEKFKNLVISDCTPKMLEDEALFYRFMKARDFNIKNADVMFRNHLIFRKEYKIDTIQTDYKAPKVLEKYGPVTFIGYDKEGNGIRYMDIGRCDAKGFIQSAKKIDCIKFNLQVQERDIDALRAHSKDLGIPARKIIFICNFDKLTLATATNKKALDLLIIAAKIMQDNYPELIKQMIVINVSLYFSFLHAVLKPFFAPALLEKMSVYGSDGYQEALLKLIDPEVLPAFLGGTKTDPDGNPNCYSFIRWGKPLPLKYKMRKSERRLSSSPGVKKLSVTRFSKSDVRFEVLVPDSTLEWEFETRSRDIGFGVFFLTDPESKPEELVPKQRIDTDVEPEVGVCKCIKPGTYIIVFDNSYSWFYPKEIFYRVRIVRPGEEDVNDWA